MKIGLIDIEPMVFNTAYMQIAEYYRQRGDTVSWWSPLTDNQFALVYCSSLFDFTNKDEVPARAICGGTGFDVTSRLSQRMEACELDYSLYPKCETSYIWFSRGCDRNCPFCVVRQKEGKFHLVKRKKLNPKGKYVTIMDNDFFTNPEWESVIAWLGRMPMDMQGFDVRKITKEQCKALAGLKQYKGKRFKTAWDIPKEDLLPKLKMLARNVRPDRITCYVLVGYDSTRAEDMYRITELAKIGLNPFVMPFNKKDPYQKRLARWVNHKAIFKSVKWKDYK